jgi:predicted DCC family thiol-disulfide oxidoreductase YuxK
MMGAMDDRHVLFYDGVCGMCDRLTQVVLDADTHDRFRFATLQGDFARTALAAHGVDLAADLPPETMYVVTRDGRLLERDQAALFVLGELDRYRRYQRLLSLVPAGLRRLGYRAVARNRYRIFGKLDACRVPRPEERGKFI